MRTVTKRELNHNTAAVLNEVTNAEEGVVVTERGRPRWKLTPLRDRDTALARLEREGRYTPPAEHPAPWPRHPGGPHYTDSEVDTILDELRGDH